MNTPSKYVAAICVLTVTACGADRRATSSETPDAGGTAGAGGTALSSSGGVPAASGAPSHANGGVTASGGTRNTVPDAQAPIDSGTPDAADAADTPRPVVAACDGLGKVDAFEDITPPDAILSNNGIVNVLVDPLHAGTVFAATDKKGLFKSTDCGAHWVKINTGKNAAVLDSGTLWSMALDPHDPNVLYAGSLYGSDLSLFKSTNGGVDFEATYAPGSEIPTTVEYNFFQDLSLDPLDPHHIVLTFHANCKGMYAPSCLAESKDAGATWRLFKSPLDGWGEGAAPRVLGPTTWLLGTTQNGIYYTGDSGASWEKVGPGMNGHLYHSAARNAFYAASDYGLEQSPDGHVWSMIQGSPTANDMIGDGTRLFTSQRNSNDRKQPYYTSLESDGTTWKPLPSPTMDHGTVNFGYDPSHKLLYSANTSSGLFRVVTR